MSTALGSPRFNETDSNIYLFYPFTNIDISPAGFAFFGANTSPTRLAGDMPSSRNKRIQSRCASFRCIIIGLVLASPSFTSTGCALNALSRSAIYWLRRSHKNPHMERSIHESVPPSCASRVILSHNKTAEGVSHSGADGISTITATAVSLLRSGNFANHDPRASSCAVGVGCGPRLPMLNLRA